MSALIGCMVTACFRSRNNPYQIDQGAAKVGRVVACQLDTKGQSNGSRCDDFGPSFRVLVFCEDGELREAWAHDCLPLPGEFVLDV
jgi:hypothetical protein